MTEKPINLFLERYSPTDRKAIVEDLAAEHLLVLPNEFRDKHIVSYKSVGKDDFNGGFYQLDYFESLLELVKDKPNDFYVLHEGTAIGGQPSLTYNRSLKKAFEL
jgi:hypothetical protein